MTRFYVYALTGSPIARFTASGRRVYSVDVDGVHVVGVRARAAMKPSEDALRRQHAIVEAIAARSDAVLPARFGSYLEMTELRRVVSSKRQAIREALDTVRGREQMTLRVPGPRTSAAPPNANRSRMKAGTAYLEARRAAVVRPDPAVIGPLRRALSGLVHAERVQPGRGVLPPAVFHLIARGRSADYRGRVADLSARLPGPPPRVSGPFPAFAFTPELS